MSVIFINPYRFAAGGVANVSLLLHGDGDNGSTNIVDSSPSPKTVTAVGGAQISTAQSRFGGASIAFDSVGDRLTVSSSDFAVGTGDFTVELWMYSFDVARKPYGAGLLQLSDAAGGLKTSYNTGITLAYGVNAGLNALDGGVGVYVGNVGLGITSGPPVFVNNTWHHVAVTRSAGIARVFVAGTQIGSSVSAPGSITGQNLCIGGYFDTSYLHNGYIDEIRFSRVARYTSNFTPPTAPFPDA